MIDIPYCLSPHDFCILISIDDSIYVPETEKKYIHLV